MRLTQWILTAAIAAICVGQANGQSGCPGCGGGSAAGQPDLMSLSGEACCSPPGYAGGLTGPGCCCGPSRPCCGNAWAGYCCHHAKVQAFLSRVGVPKVRAYPGAPKETMPVAPCPCVEHSIPTAQPTPTVAPTVARFGLCLPYSRCQPPTRAGPCRSSRPRHQRMPRRCPTKDGNADQVETAALHSDRESSVSG